VQAVFHAPVLANDPKPKNEAKLKLRIFLCDGSLEVERRTGMGKGGHSEEEILRVLREAESGDTVMDVCRKHGISQQTYYLWKKKYAGLGLNELRELRQLREENAKLKRLVADLSLDRHVLQEIVRKNC
jgi:putative transposase